MNVKNDLRAAMGIDRLIADLNLTSPPRDPMMQACQQLEQGVWAQFAQVAADEQFRARRMAQWREREQPGYTANLNRQRALMCLPPI